MKYIKEYNESEEDEDVSKKYKEEIIKSVEDNFKLNPLNLIDDFIEIEDTGIFDVDISFIVRLNKDGRDNYPKNAHIERFGKTYSSELLQKRSIYERSPYNFYYGLSYIGYPIKKEDVIDRIINILIIVREQEGTPGKHLDFLPIFKSKISEVCKRYNLKPHNPAYGLVRKYSGNVTGYEGHTLDKMGYVSYTIGLTPNE